MFRCTKISKRPAGGLRERKFKIVSWGDDDLNNNDNYLIEYYIPWKYRVFQSYRIIFLVDYVYLHC